MPAKGPGLVRISYIGFSLTDDFVDKSVDTYQNGVFF